MTLKNKTHVYFMPGMCANPLIFERIKLSSNFKPHYLNWISPLKNESLQDYVIRLSKYIKHNDSILVGVSFGGVIVQELSKILKVIFDLPTLNCSNLKLLSKSKLDEI